MKQSPFRHTRRLAWAAAMLAMATASALAQQLPVHTPAEARAAAAAAGYSNVSGFERRGGSFWTTAIDGQGNRVRLRIDGRNGQIAGVNVLEAGAHPPFPNLVPPQMPVGPRGIEPGSYYVGPPTPSTRLPGIGGPRLGLPGPTWCQTTAPNGPGC